MDLQVLQEGWESCSPMDVAKLQPCMSRKHFLKNMTRLWEVIETPV